MGKTSIEWATDVWNPVTGCSPVSEGCANCYAARFAKRLAGRCGYPKDEPFRVTLHPERLGEPLRWRKPRRVFVASMGDLFHKDVPDEFIDEVWRVMMLARRRGSRSSSKPGGSGYRSTTLRTLKPPVDWLPSTGLSGTSIAVGGTTVKRWATLRWYALARSAQAACWTGESGTRCQHEVRFGE